jgi:hypothetical protein
MRVYGALMWSLGKVCGYFGVFYAVFRIFGRFLYYEFKFRIFAYYYDNNCAHLYISSLNTQFCSKIAHFSSIFICKPTLRTP